MTRLLLCLLLLCALPTQGADLRLYLHNTEGGSYTDSAGELRGKHHLGRPALIVELVRTLMIEDNLKPLMSVVNFNEGQQLIAATPSSALVDISPSNDQPLSDHWVGPIQSDSIYFFSHRQSQPRLSSLKEAKKVSSICVRSSTNHAAILRRQGFTNVITASSYRVCWDKLISGEVALTTLGENLIPAITQLAKDISANIKNTGIKLHHQDSYIAFSKDTTKTRIRRWQASLDQLKNSPDYQTLIHHFYCQQDCF